MWENGGDVFWLEHEVNAGLQCYLVPEARTAFVPLCGNSNSMIYMHEKGIKVTGLEFHEDAVRQFFEENNLEYVTGEDKMKFYETKCSGIRIYVGDLFAFETDEKFDFIWDRGSLVAISPEDRGRYAVLMSSLLADNGKILLEGIQFGENPKSVYKDVGPPGAPYNLGNGLSRMDGQCYASVHSTVPFYENHLHFRWFIKTKENPEFLYFDSVMILPSKM